MSNDIVIPAATIREYIPKRYELNIPSVLVFPYLRRTGGTIQARAIRDQIKIMWISKFVIE
jgi:hypothetical protein